MWFYHGLSGSFFPETQPSLAQVRKSEGALHLTEETTLTVMLHCSWFLLIWFWFLVAHVKQHPIHSQMRIWAKIPNDSYADFWDSFSVFFLPGSYYILQIEVTSVSSASNLCLFSFARPVCLVWGREGALKREVDLTCLPSDGDLRSARPDVWCRKRDVLCVLLSFLSCL